MPPKQAGSSAASAAAGAAARGDVGDDVVVSATSPATQDSIRKAFAKIGDLIDQRCKTALTPLPANVPMLIVNREVRACAPQFIFATDFAGDCDHIVVLVAPSLFFSPLVDFP